MLRTFKLKNGIRVAAFDLPNLKSIHLRTLAKGGSLIQKQGQNGITHLMEHMLVQGSPSFPSAEKLSEFVEGLAGTYGAYTLLSSVGFNITLPASYLETAVKVVGEVFFEPLFDNMAIEKERSVMIDEIRQNMDAKWYKISQFYRRSRFANGHPLAFDPGGTIEDVRSLKKEDLVKFWGKCCLPGNTYIIAVGNFSAAHLDQLFEQYLVKHQPKTPPPDFPKMGKGDFANTAVALRHDLSLQTSYVDLTLPSLNLSHPIKLRLMQELALTILGTLRSSRLFKLLRIQKGLVYNVRAGASIFPGLGYVYITSEASKENLHEVVTLITQQLKNFADNGPTEEELQFAKNFLSNQWLMEFDHPGSIADWIQGELLWEKEIVLPEETIKEIKKVKVSDIINLMREYWDFSKLILSIQGSVEDTRENTESYGKIIKLVRS